MHAGLSRLLSHRQALVSAIPLVAFRRNRLGLTSAFVNARGNGRPCQNVSSVAAIVRICLSRFPVWERAREVCVTLKRTQFQQPLRTKQSPSTSKTMAGSGCHGSTGNDGAYVASRCHKHPKVGSANGRAGLWAALWDLLSPSLFLFTAHLRAASFLAVTEYAYLCSCTLSTSTPTES